MPLSSRLTSPLLSSATTRAVSSFSAPPPLHPSFLRLLFINTREQEQEQEQGQVGFESMMA
jgi:hypothetical protein